jgi:hypothetical protein
MKEKEKAAADAASHAVLASIGTDLMNAYNHGKTDPSDMAVMGHDSSRGYEFCIERGGRTAVVSVAWDLE